MQTFIRSYLLICCFLFCAGIVMAQQKADSPQMVLISDSSTSSNKTNTMEELPAVSDSSANLRHKKSYVKLSLSYLNDNVYLGRKDSVALPYITPTLAYFHKSGLFIEGSVSYLASVGQSRIDMASIDGGYSFSKGNYDGDLMASKYFYNSQSTSVRSELEGSLAYFNAYDFGFVTATATATLNFGNKTDVAGQFGLEHTMYAFDDRMNFTPTFVANASTQNYYNNYYRNRRYKIRRKGKAPTTGIAKVSGTLKDASSFKVLDYELSLPMNYKVGKFNFNFTPVFAIPVHPNEVAVTTTLENNNSTTKVHTEKIGNSFFGSIGISYKFSR